MVTKGYTLIEILVAIGIFTIVIAAPTGFFVTSLKGQQKALSSQELIDNVSYTLEYISRAIRMAKKELSVPTNCLSENGLNYEIIQDGGKYGIKFNSYLGDCQEFFWDTNDNRLKESRNGGMPVPLTSENLEIVSFKIGPDESWDQNDNEQPRVTLFFEVKGTKDPRPELQPVIKIQTTISQRNLDVIY